MEDAIALSGEMPANQAALQYGVPRSTLKDRLSGRVKHSRKPGPQSYLDPEEEQGLVEHLINAAQKGYGKTRKEVKHIAESVACEKKLVKKNKISNGWWRGFTERNPMLCLRQGDATAHVRMNAINRAITLLQEGRKRKQITGNWRCPQPSRGV